ncbi:anaerobic ribonucleoside-triphosphate reductase activating protein [Serpentinicella alkaliphila]|uniref:Pyruvate formate lyase activating enzyme n=1 Tax=Serpentinicella alkaliphila TaxID=1734049 RepID=A0A4R2U3G9_9FIRM|nr:anaerobic ribonucleoside-triphosphate reductase activating protein [Serpentinicella alkaliphila]QUH24537.1 anaerobic ribonucleoside-triphosphate reductase activating protein [Serpentinicella alkaliphila]TCQ04629.1 pyruvate formate lyase activating enzyme [Serpentinicella alkaliphila]
MNILGQQKSSFIDYPNKISTVYFTGGCNFKCPYCHNKDLVNSIGTKFSEDEIFSFLLKRKKFIDAVCISGGEPTLQKDLYKFISKLKSEGFFVKLDTNGYSPDILESLIKDEMLDYIAMDIKGPLYAYEKIAGVKIDVNLIKKSIDIIKGSNIDYEFRTTICRELITIKDIVDIANMLKGSKSYFLQNFRDGDTVLYGKNCLTPYDKEELEELEAILKDYFELFRIK